MPSHTPSGRPIGVRAAAVRTATLATALGVVLCSLTSVASADPLPAGYRGHSHGDILSVDLELATDVVSASLGHAATVVDSTATPRAEAAGATLHAGSVGIRTDPQTVGAQAGPAEGTDGYDTGLTDVDQPGLLETGVITASGRSEWAGDFGCVPSGDPIATATTSVSSATLGGIELRDVLELDLLEIGTTTTTGSTRLVDGSVVSTSAGKLPDADLLNGNVRLHVVEQPMITATSDGTTGASSTNDYAIEVEVGSHAAVTLRGGDSLPIKVNLDDAASTDLVLTVGRLDDTSFGPTGSGTLNFLRLEGTINALPARGGRQLAAIDLGLLPLNASATGAPGAVECEIIAPPTITEPATGSETNESPVISGTGIPGARVQVTDGDTVSGNEFVDADGNWSLIRDEVIAVGEHRLFAVQTLDDASSAPSNAVTFTVLDTMAPNPPDFVRPQNEAWVSETTPTISGWGEPGAMVHLSKPDGTQLGSAPVDSQYNWSLTLDALEEGQHILWAHAVDDAGNRSEGTAEPLEITVDTRAPAAPQISGPQDGAVISDQTPAITGTAADPSAQTIEVALDGAVIGRTVQGSGGSWTFRPPDPLTTGSHTLSATNDDGHLGEPAVNVSDVATSTVFIDAIAPATPAINEPADGSITGDSTPVMSGVAEPDATVRVSDTDGRELGTTTADSGGRWSVDDSVELVAGEHTITAVATDAAGNATGSAPVRFTVDTAARARSGDGGTDDGHSLAAPAAPVITGPSEAGISGTDPVTIIGTGDAGAIVRISIDGDLAGSTQVNDDGEWSFLPGDPLGEGDHTVSATAADSQGNASPSSNEVTFTVDTTEPEPPRRIGPVDGPTTRDLTPVITGLGEPGATVRLFVGMVRVDATVGEDGGWRVEVPRNAYLGNGFNTVTAEQTDPAGNRSGHSDRFAFTIDSYAAQPTIIQPRSGSRTNDTTPSMSGIGEPGAAVTVSTADGSVISTGVVDEEGNWSVESTELAGGDHTITATQIDLAGNTSPQTEPMTLTIDTAAPTAPIVIRPNAGSAVNDASPMIIGTGEPGATVTVAVDGVDVGSPMVGEDGGWALVPTEDLPDGEHTVAANQTDLAGNESARSEPVTFMIDTAAPAAPVITGAGGADVLSGRSLMITGTGEPGARVTVADQEGDILGAGVVDGRSTWRVDPAELIGSEHTVLATQSDRAGNASSASKTVTFELGDPAPRPPVGTPPEDGPGDGTGGPGGGGGGAGDGTEDNGQGGGNGAGAGNGAHGNVDGSRDSGADGGDLPGTGVPPQLSRIALIGLLALVGGLIVLRRRGETTGH